MNSRYRSDEDALAATVPLAGRSVLDIGCGKGGMMRFMRSQGAVPTGVECTASQRDAARDADPDHRDAYVDGVGQDLPFEDASFDVATFSYSLHHVPGDAMDTALSEAARVVKPGGHVYVAEPVAAGPGHEVDRIIDDETEVRALALEALGRASAAGLETVAEETYLTAYTYADFDAYIAAMLGVDATRKAAYERSAAAVGEAFHRNARKVDGGFLFEQQVRTWLFRKR